MVVLRIPDPYQAPDFIRAYEPRFWSRVNRNGRCWEWTGTLRAERRSPTVELPGGRTLTVFDFAYRATVGDIWSTLMAKPLVCENEMCVRGDHLRLRRRKNLGPLSPAEVDEAFAGLYLRAGRAVHRELGSEDAIAQVMGVQPEEIEHAFRSRRFRG